MNVQITPSIKMAYSGTANASLTFALIEAETV